MFKIEMGSEVTDVVTGFKGIVTAQHLYITGCAQYDLTPPLKKDGTLADIISIDEGRLKVSRKKPVQMVSFEKPKKKKSTGGPQSKSKGYR